MSNRKTIKALEDLAKTEYVAAAALDSAFTEADDGRIRRNYRKWRDLHMQQASALNRRIAQLGGAPAKYEAHNGNGHRRILGRITGTPDDNSVTTLRLDAERSIRRYLDHLGEIDDREALYIIGKNLENSQDEIEWFDEQANRERQVARDTTLENTRGLLRELEQEARADKKERAGGAFPLSVVFAAGALSMAGYLMMRNSDKSDYEDLMTEEAGYEPNVSTNGST